jgi:hypothetical protein
VLKIFRGKLKRIKTINSMQNIKQSGSKTGQLKHHGNPVMGASGGIGLVAGTGAKIAKGAINLVKSIFKKKRTTSITNPIPGSTKAYNKLQYPMGKKAYSSKPVDFKGPNPAHNTGAGGNSYPK